MILSDLRQMMIGKLPSDILRSLDELNLKMREGEDLDDEPAIFIRDFATFFEERIRSSKRLHERFEKQVYAPITFGRPRDCRDHEWLFRSLKAFEKTIWEHLELIKRY